jgi:hypothetical protein
MMPRIEQFRIGFVAFDKETGGETPMVTVFEWADYDLMPDGTKKITAVGPCVASILTAGSETDVDYFDVEAYRQHRSKFHPPPEEESADEQ